MEIILNGLGGSNPIPTVTKKDFFEAAWKHLADKAAFEKYGGEDKFRKIVEGDVKKIIERARKDGMIIEGEERGYLT